MTVASLRVERVSPCEVERHLAELGAFRLIRTDAGLWLEIADDLARRAVAMLARAGLRPGSGDVPATRGLVPAIVPHLDPLGAADVVDVVMLRTVGAGEATARLTRGGLLRRHADRDGIHAVLTGADRAFLWRRAVYARPKALRALRGVRPIVFDHGALERAEERLGFVGRSALTRWIA